MGFDPRLTVVAIGGNATFPPTIRGTAEEQFAIVNESCGHLARMVEGGYRLVLTHGNGPVIGNILIRMALASGVIAPMPMDICVADSQGGIGYIIQQSLLNRLRERDIFTPVVCLVTQVEVSADDPAFQRPSKPIGPFYNQEQAQRIQAETGWYMLEDSGRGYRRVVPSPRPVTILELDAVRRCVEAGIIPITVGGGGIPVVRMSDGRCRGMDAVIDKDLASAILALELRAGILLILTGVEAVALDFGKPTQRSVATLTVGKAKEYLEAGQFPEGSMGPKVRAAIQYIEGGGQTVLITSLEQALEALQGKAGTRIEP